MVRPNTWLAKAVFASWLLWLGIGILLIVVHREASEIGVYEYWLESIVGSTVFAIPGVMLAVRRPANVIGWFFLAGGSFSSFQLATGEYAVFALRVRHGDLPGGDVAALISNSVQVSVVLTFLLLLLLFPTGSLPTPRWRVGAYLLLAGFGCVTVGSAFGSGPLESLPFVQSPLRVTGGEALFAAVVGVGGSLAVAGGVVALASLLVRYRRSKGEQRQQLKLFAYAAVLGIVIILVTPERFGSVAWTLAPSGLPVAAGIAILRYRLYDIDRIISRTIVYAAVTAFLAAFYFGVVISLQAVVGERVGTSPLAVAATTLAVAALFRPARSRIQDVIDRRFNRRRFDAQQTVEAFGARLRDEVDLDDLRADLMGVVSDTMQPAHVSLWLRASGAGR